MIQDKSADWGSYNWLLPEQKLLCEIPPLHLKSQESWSTEQS